MIRKVFWSAWILLSCLLQGCSEDPVYAFGKSDTILAVIGEAEGESQVGKEAVACAINNRGTLKGVHGLYSDRVTQHLYSKDTYNKAQAAVQAATNKNYCDELIHGAQYWDGTAFPVPYWAKSMKLVAVIDNQRFFRKERIHNGNQ